MTTAEREMKRLKRYATIAYLTTLMLGIAIGAAITASIFLEQGKQHIEQMH